MRATADARDADMTSIVIATRGERLVLMRPRLGPRSAARGVPQRGARRRRDQLRRSDRGDRRVRPRRLRRRHRRARCPIPRRRSGRPRAHMVGRSLADYAALNRHELPPTTPDWVNIDHRRRTAFGPGDADRIHPCRAGTSRQDTKLYVEAVHRLSDLGAVVTYAAHATSHEGFDAEWRGINLLDGRRRPGQPLLRYSTRQTSTPRSRGSSSSAGRRRGWKTRQAKWPSASWRTSRPATGTPWRRYWPTTSPVDDRRRVVSAGVRHGRDAEIANMRAIADLGITIHDVDRHRDPWGAPHPRASASRAAITGPRQFLTEVLGIVEINADERIVGDRRVRPRRLRRRLRGTRCPVPRRRSGRPRAHVVGDRGGLRRAQPARTPRDDAGLGEHRPPAGAAHSRPVT